MLDRKREAEAIAAWNRRASGWVSVEERLPEERQRILWRGLGAYNSWNYQMDRYNHEIGFGWATEWLAIPDAENPPAPPEDR